MAMTGPKVLLVDDDAAFTKVFGMALRHAGHQVSVAHSGAEALRGLPRTRPDLVILDIAMPRMNGWEVCKRIRQMSDVPILVLTVRRDAVAITREGTARPEQGEQKRAPRRRPPLGLMAEERSHTP